MAVLFSSSPLTFLSPSHAALPLSTAMPSLKLGAKRMNALANLSRGLSLATPVIPKRMDLVIAKASETDGTEPAQASWSQSESKEETVPVDKLPLESKLQERMEQKLKMKMAKKIRLRRKQLLRKRKMRKKGRWPPSKMKKLKNV